MYECILIKEKFKLHIIRKLRSRYPSAVMLSGPESGGTVAAHTPSASEINVAPDYSSLFNQAITELSDIGFITSSKSTINTWLVCLTDFGLENTKTHL